MKMIFPFQDNKTFFTRQVGNWICVFRSLVNDSEIQLNDIKFTFIVKCEIDQTKV